MPSAPAPRLGASGDVTRTGCRDAARDALRNWPVLGGLASLFLWTWLLYWGGPFSLRPHTIDLANARWAANVILCAAALGIATALSCRRRSQGRGLSTGLLVVGMVCGLAGTALALWLAISPDTPDEALRAAAVASGALTGVGEGLYLCVWCTTTSYLGVRVSLAYNLVAMAVSGLFFLGCNVAPSWLSLSVGLACPVIGLACAAAAHTLFTEAYPASRTSPSESRDAHATCGGEGSNHAAGKAVDGDRSQLGMLLHDTAFVRLLAIAGLFGVSSGFVNASFELVPKDLYWVACYGVVAGMVVAAALAFVTAFTLRMSAWQLVFRVSLPLIALSYLLMPYAAYALVGPGVHSLGYQFFFATYWPLLGAAQLRRDAPAACSVSLGLCATQSGMVMGLCLWNGLCAGGGADAVRLAAMVALFVAVTVAVVFEKPSFGWATVRPGAPVSIAAPDMETVVDVVARRHGLSPREAQVCVLLGRGRNRQFVADELGISLETAKSHATSVYRKLGVHSQQELLDVLEMTEDDIRSERVASRADDGDHSTGRRA